MDQYFKSLCLLSVIVDQIIEQVGCCGELEATMHDVGTIDQALDKWHEGLMEFQQVAASLLCSHT